MSTSSTETVAGFDKPRHVKFWKRCAALLPDHYISADASRMSLGFFIVTALDLLGVLETEISKVERQSWIEWIYSCQVTDETPSVGTDSTTEAGQKDRMTPGGFRGFSGTHLQQFRNERNEHWDPANLPNTYFALAALLVLGDDLKKVRKQECLEWLSRLQLADGSMGEFLGEDKQIRGGKDLRLCCCGAGIAYILQSLPDSETNGLSRSSQREEHSSKQRFDEARMIRYILNCQTYDGGFAQAPSLEAHSGLNYCGVAALSFLARLRRPQLTFGDLARSLSVDMASCVRWMLDRQTSYIDSPDSDDETTDEDGGKGQSNDYAPAAIIDQDSASGFNGRCGKMADTCYCFWTGGALDICGGFGIVETCGLQKYLINHTQHVVGGFGKVPGMPPDLLHSCLGLAALSVGGHPSLKPIDSTMCISQDAASRLSASCQH